MSIIAAARQVISRCRLETYLNTPIPSTIEQEFNDLLAGDLTEEKTKQIIKFILEKSDKHEQTAFDVTPPPSPKNSETI